MPRQDPQAPTPDGLLLVDKPAGMSSHDVVDIVRRAWGISRVGHSGTLDPFATGLLVLLVGKATRLLSFLDLEPKEYIAEICFGNETNTDDSTGEVTASAPAPDMEQIEAQIAALTGEFDQVPPAFSAVHVDGVRAYRSARKGQHVSIPARAVVVHAWQMHSYENAILSTTIRCAGGTYIRALARDLGRRCGSAAHLRTLRRSRVGRYHVDAAMTIEAVRSGGMSVEPLRPSDTVLQSVTVSDAERRTVMNGGRIPAQLDCERALLLEEGGAILAVAVSRDGEWQPRVVLGDG